MIEFFKSNYQWIFSGIGVVIISILISIYLRRFRNSPTRAITHKQTITMGNQSPGEVHGDYTVGKTEDPGLNSNN